MSRAYYNEIDPFAAEWLRELIRAGETAPGDVDERDIRDVLPKELDGYDQCHFFAGIGGWSRALRQAGWPDDRPVWTGSCPCQPFSAAGKGAGVADERHLWPAFFHLIRQCKPVRVFGEQVEAAIKHSWLDLVQDDLEGIGYAVGAVGFPAASVGAPHIRQRLYFVGEWLDDAASARCERSIRGSESEAWNETRLCLSGERSEVGLVADAQLSGRRGRGPGEVGVEPSTVERSERFCASCGHPDDWHDEGLGCQADNCECVATPHRGHAFTGELADPNGWNSRAEREQRSGEQRLLAEGGGVVELGDSNDPRPQGLIERGNGSGERLAGEAGLANFWSPCDWLPCTDGKARPVEPGTFPLAHGATNRVGRLRGYGNAIVAPQAQAFIEAYLDTLEGAQL